MSGDEDDFDVEEEEEEEEEDEDEDGDGVDVSLGVAVTFEDGDDDDDDDDDGGGGGGGGNRRGGGNCDDDDDNDDDDDEEEEDSTDDNDNPQPPVRQPVERPQISRGVRSRRGGRGGQGSRSGWDQEEDDDSDTDDDDNLPSANPAGGRGPRTSRGGRGGRGSRGGRGGQGGQGSRGGQGGRDNKRQSTGLRHDLGDSSCSSDGSSDDNISSYNPQETGRNRPNRRGPLTKPGVNNDQRGQAGPRNIDGNNTSSDSTNSFGSSSQGPNKARGKVKNPPQIPVGHLNSRHLPDRSSYVRSGADVVHQYAQLYFQKVLSSNMQKRARDQIKKMDTNGDGKVVLEELLRSFSSKSTKRSVKKLFKFLDTDNNGFLNFEECITVFYLQQVGYSACKLCEDPIFNSGYSCQICWDKGAIDGSTFDVCIDCYTRMRPSQHSHKEFVDMHVLHTQTSKIAAAVSSMVQCISCGDFHNKNISSYLVQGEDQMHVNNEFVCEWCRAWPCISCGKYIQAPASAAKPKMFLNASYYCRNCKTAGSLLDMSPIIRAIMNNTQLQDDCATCAIKIRTGDLFAIPTKTAVVTALVDENIRNRTNRNSRRPPQRRPGQPQGGNSLATVSQIVNNVANVAAIGNNLLGPLVGTDASCDVQ